MAFHDLKSFYRSKEWTQFRQIIISERLARDGEIICEYCKKPILNSYETIAHHCNIYLTEQNVNDYSISLNPENIQLVHHGCHSKIHEKGFQKKKVYIVFGSSQSGKSTFVNEAMLENDMVICVDRLYEAITNNRSNKLLSTVMDLQRYLLDTVKTRKGNWTNAYVITTSIFNAKRMRDLIDPDQIIHIDTPKEICYERAKKKIQLYGDDYKNSLDRYWDEVENNQMLLEELINN